MACFRSTVTAVKIKQKVAFNHNGLINVKKDESVKKT